MYGCRKMQGGREELLLSVFSACPAVVSFKREPQIRFHHFRMCLAQIQAFCRLFIMQKFFLFSLCLAVLKWSTFPTANMEHPCRCSHHSPREPVWSWHLCAAVSQPCQLLGPGGSFHILQMDGKAKTHVF